MTGCGLALETGPCRCHDPGTVLTDGQRIAWRRDRLGWNQRLLAKRAGVGLATITRIEKDRNVQQATMRAVLGALDAGEAARPDLLRQPAGEELVPATKAGDTDVILRLRKTQKQLHRMEVFLSGAVDEIRQALADLDDVADEGTRRRA